MTERTLMPELYTKEEIDEYFGGIDDPGIRYRTRITWYQMWVVNGRFIIVDTHKKKDQLKRFVKNNKIRKVDYVDTHVAWAFRHDEDYFAAKLTIS
jgi:hypothetical protein